MKTRSAALKKEQSITIGSIQMLVTATLYHVASDFFQVYLVISMTRKCHSGVGAAPTEV